MNVQEKEERRTHSYCARSLQWP